MTQYDWTADHGNKWLAQLGGLESMMEEIDAPLLEALSLKKLSPNESPVRIADIACGGGGTTFKIESLVPSSCVVHGYDISSALINAATRRAKQQASRVEFNTANLQIAPPSQPYDYLVSRFGVMFFDDPQTAFANIHRWLKPEGRFSFAVWGDPKENPWISSLQAVARQFVDLPKPDRQAPGPFRYSDPDLLIQELDAANFKQFNTSTWKGSLPLGGGIGAADATDFALSMFTLAEPLAEAGSTVLHDAKQALTELLKTHEVDGKVMMDAEVYIVSGQA